jgi:hypothetical protein
MPVLKFITNTIVFTNFNIYTALFFNYLCFNNKNLIKIL